MSRARERACDESVARFAERVRKRVKQAGEGARMTAEHVIYAIESLIYLIIFLMGLAALRGMRRDLKRIADRMEEPE